MVSHLPLRTCEKLKFSFTRFQNLSNYSNKSHMSFNFTTFIEKLSYQVTISTTEEKKHSHSIT